MFITIHRGSHEIGGSCVELSTAQSRIIIDIGMPLVTPTGEKFEMKNYSKQSLAQLVANKILPDVIGLYEPNVSLPPIDGLMISHAHLDHYGFYRYVQPSIPFYMSAGTKTVIDVTAKFVAGDYEIKNCTLVETNKQYHIGDFTVTPYLVDHAGYDARAFVIKAEGKTVIYSGDVRMHGRKAKSTRIFVDLAPNSAERLLLEGTMLSRPGERCQTEGQLEAKLHGIIKKSKNIVFFLSSSQNIDRIVTAFRAVRETEKLLVVDFYQASVLAMLKRKSIPHPSQEYKEIKVFLPPGTDRYAKSKGLSIEPFIPYGIDIDGINRHRRDIVMMVRPPMIRYLQQIKDLRDGWLVYSQWEGYKEDVVVKRFLEFATSRGMQEISVHTSGHADQQSLQEIVDKLKPEALSPIHTQSPDRYKEFGVPIVMLKDGQRDSI